MAKRDLAEVSKQSEDQFIEEWMVGDTPYPFGPCGGKQLYLAYTRWCRANGVRFPRNSIQFLNRVGKMPGWFCGKDARYRIWDNTHYTGPKTNPLRFVVPDQTQLALIFCCGWSSPHFPRFTRLHYWQLFFCFSARFPLICFQAVCHTWLELVLAG
uniref:Uncharacterized protein n=1 Tax=Candidatus Kentrum sp. TC TaxID=2126339 RepID=A0A450Z4G2_9GAMM|nr:MAG: hypothetical protein BECKTC1821E_GA0114239_11247 [Candidatus Kentron sp. TC]